MSRLRSPSVAFSLALAVAGGCTFGAPGSQTSPTPTATAGGADAAPTPTPTPAPTRHPDTLKFTAIVFAGEDISAVIANLTGAAVDLDADNWQMCGGGLVYGKLGLASIAPSSSVKIHLNALPSCPASATEGCLVNPIAATRARGNIALYRGGSNAPAFTNALHIMDFVQWGEGAQGREAVAVAARIWEADKFVTAPTTDTATLSAKVAGASGSDNWQ